MNKLVLAFVLLFVCNALAVIDQFKNLQGPPEEFDNFKLPEPKDSEVTSDSAVVPLFFTKNSNGEQSWSGDISIDSATMATVSLVSKDAAKFRLDVLSVSPTNEVPVPSEVDNSWFGRNKEHSQPSKTYVFKKPPQGKWSVKVTLESNDKEVDPDFYLILFNESPYRVASHIQSFSNFAKGKVNFVASLNAVPTSVVYDHDGKSSSPVPRARINKLSADLDVKLPNGEEDIVHMHDDGLHNDGQANDGVFGADIDTETAGLYAAQVLLKGQAIEGDKLQEVQRTSEHLVVVLNKEVELIQKSTINLIKNDEMAEIDLHVKVLSKDAFGKKYKAFAQVWSAKDDKAVAWISGMSIANKVSEDEAKLTLKMSTKWITRSGINDVNLVLKKLYIQDVNSNIATSTLDSTKPLAVQMNGHYVSQSEVYGYLPSFNGEITETMKVGVRPLFLSSNKTTNAGHKVLLVHGYCTAGNPFTVADFTDYHEFADPKSSRSHDEFALLIGEAGKDFDSFSVVGHSQGGLAALHLLTFYWSKQDIESQGTTHRVLQTVGSPWLGNSLAGTLANMGESFGFMW